MTKLEILYLIAGLSSVALIAAIVGTVEIFKRRCHCDRNRKKNS